MLGPWAEQWNRKIGSTHRSVGAKEDSLGMPMFAVNGGPRSIHRTHFPYENARAIRRRFPVRESRPSIRYTDDFRDRVCISCGERRCARQRSGRDRYLEFAQVEERFLKIHAAFLRKEEQYETQNRDRYAFKKFPTISERTSSAPDFNRWH